MHLAVENLSYRLGQRSLINDISFSLKTNERVALIGPNGSGKSTLLRLMCGLKKPSSGSVFIDGRAVREYPRRLLAQHLAFVQQKASTDDLITVENAVALGRTPWIKAFERWSDAHQRHVEQALEQVEMDTQRSQYWHTLSGGEQQRTHIARALAQDTPLIIMDEPTNHLDIKHQLGVLSLIQHIQKTLLIAVHDLNHAMHFDRIIALDKGEMIANGTPEEVINEAFIKEVYGVDSRIIRSAGLPPHIQLLQTHG